MAIEDTRNEMSGRAGTVVQARRIRIGGSDDRRGLYALLVVALVLVLVIPFVVWRMTATNDPDTPLAVVTSVSLPADCDTGWVVPEPGDAVPRSERPAGAVLSSGGEVAVNVQGLTGRAVVLRKMEVEVVDRAPAMRGAFLQSGCGSDMTPRHYRLELSAGAPELLPGKETQPFPYKVAEADPEQFVITPFARAEHVRWRLHLHWSSGDEEGDLVVDDNGEPFGTTDTTATTGRFCLEEPDHRRWVPGC
ncbi:hypothetical protein JOF41_001528 [Saccharothrix coeruleofusca]|uniref:hypothetical protein n=1 Tax=Saccharothrix coeruleofusca TaxID=33919 RepID=UPI001AEA4FEA|nr:hypothetical protein [Saccharothrix coeruleofusca]MBP2335350.1 hypothetical protein [Saccharothrix coeruleofusca]